MFQIIDSKECPFVVSYEINSIINFFRGFKYSNETIRVLSIDLYLFFKKYKFWKKCWLIYQSLLFSIGDRYVIETDGLLIKGVDYNDAGTYTCRARVLETGSLEERDIKLEVHTTYKR